MTEDVYFEMISQKTASLIATSCELGAITTTKKKKIDKQHFLLEKILEWHFK